VFQTINIVKISPLKKHQRTVNPPLTILGLFDILNGEINLSSGGIVMSYDSRLKSPNMELLYEAILQLQSKEECYRFFEDLCTIRELQTFAQRIQVAHMLTNKVTYQIIMDQTGASTTTIGRVNKSLIYGANGYKMIFERLKDKGSR
jgi:TrpR-related protein YerC/YecD